MLGFLDTYASLDKRGLGTQTERQSLANELSRAERINRLLQAATESTVPGDEEHSSALPL